MALTNARRLAKILGNNNLVTLDSDTVVTSFLKGSGSSSGIVTTYTSIDDLPGSSTTGDRAFITSTNKYYFYNGSGWYRIQTELDSE